MIEIRDSHSIIHTMCIKKERTPIETSIHSSEKFCLCIKSQNTLIYMCQTFQYIFIIPLYEKIIFLAVTGLWCSPNEIRVGW